MHGYLDFLQYGVLGLCAIMLVSVRSVITKEQQREGYPRQGIVRSSYVFMVFCVIIAVINGYVQLNDQKQKLERLQSGVKNQLPELFSHLEGVPGDKDVKRALNQSFLTLSNTVYGIDAKR